MTERPAAGERAVIVQLDFGQPDLEDQLEEVRLLAEAVGHRVGITAEFMLVGPLSDRAYEAVAVTVALPGDIVRAVECLGLARGGCGGGDDGNAVHGKVRLSITRPCWRLSCIYAMARFAQPFACYRAHNDQDQRNA